MIVYYKTDDDKAVWLNAKDEIKTASFLKMPHKNAFEMVKGYKRTETDLRQYKENLLRENEELKTFHFDFLKHYNNRSGIWNFFKFKATNILKKYKFESIVEYEYDFIEDCHNGGLTYFNENFKDIPTTCYGYDIPRFYPSLLCDKMLFIPLSKGTLKTIDTIPDEFPYGIYRCKITSEDPNIKKLFAFSKKQTYTSISLNNAIYLRDKKKMAIDIELSNQQNNALVYENVIDSKLSLILG